MSLYVNTTLIGCIAFIMIFTYTAESIVFFGLSDDNYSYEANIRKYDNFFTQSQKILSKEGFLNNGYIVSKDQVLNSTFWHVYHLPAGSSSYIIDFVGFIGQYHDKNNNLFIDYKTGTEMYNSLPVDLALFQVLEKSNFDSLYNSYLKTNGLEYDKTTGGLITFKKDLFSSAIDFLGKIPDMFAKIVDLFTFNIKSPSGVNAFPAEMTIILNIFFIPMWIVLSIEILPLIAKIIESIGSLIPF